MKRIYEHRILIVIILLAVVAVLAGPKWMQKWELSRQWKKWHAQNIMDYRYKVSIIGGWGANSLMPLTLSYQNGQLVSALDAEGNTQEMFWDTMGGIDAVFQEANVSLDKKRRDVTEIRYDPIYAFLTHVDIYYHETGVGAEYSKTYTISHFEVLSNPPQ